MGNMWGTQAGGLICHLESFYSCCVARCRECYMPSRMLRVSSFVTKWNSSRADYSRDRTRGQRLLPADRAGGEDLDQGDSSSINMMTLTMTMMMMRMRMLTMTGTGTVTMTTIMRTMRMTVVMTMTITMTTMMMMLELTRTKVRRERAVVQTGGVVGCGVICSRSQDCTLFRSDGDQCTLARVRSRTREHVEGGYTKKKSSLESFL